MQKATFAIVLALTLSCACAVNYTASSWVKTPVKILENTDYNFTNASSLTLGGMSTSDVNVIGYNNAVNTTTNTTASNWTIYTKAFNTKSLEASTNTSYAFMASNEATPAIGYAFSFELVNDTTTNNIPQYFLYQTKINGNVASPRIQLTSNTNQSDTPALMGGTSNTKNQFYFIAYWDKINFTSISFGGSAVGKEFTLMNTTTPMQINAVWGEAVSSSQAVISYYVGTILNVAVVDFSAGTITTQGTGVVAGKYDDKLTGCMPYATDKKYYGVWCTNTSDDNMVTVYVSSNTTTDLFALFSYNMTEAKESIQSVMAYSGYLTFFYKNSTTSNATTLSYATWDVSAATMFGNKTTYLTYDPAYSAWKNYRIPEGGLYGMLWEKNGTAYYKTDVVVGQIMGASYLTTVFGFFMTIVAGLFLF